MTDLSTVLTVVRNGASFIADAIESVRAQTATEWELIIVDDASADSTVSIVEAFAQRDSRIQLVRLDQNVGPYAAANVGLRSARGRFVFRLDADDLALPDRIQRQLDFLRAHSELRACLGAWQVIDSTGRVEPRVSRLPQSPRVLSWVLCVLPGYLHSSACVERSLFDELGGYGTGRVAEDYRLWCRISRQGWLGALPDVVGRWRRHERQITAANPSGQRDVHLEVLDEHLDGLTGRRWTTTDVLFLYLVGRTMPIDVREGLRILDEFERSWSQDSLLNAAERRELRQITTTLRLKHLRWRVRDQPTRTLKAAPRVLMRAADVLPRPPQLP